jgi:hypothetical protein
MMKPTWENGGVTTWLFIIAGILLVALAFRW